MTEFKFSLLISLYNKERPEYFEMALESIQKQTILPHEIVIVFDGYIGNELENVVCKFQKLLPIKVIRLEQNVGLGCALNEGLKYCSYNWVFRMDTDDYCVRDRFEKQIKYLMENPNIVILGAQMEEFNNKIGDLGIIREVPLAHEKIKKFSLTRNPFNHISIVFKKDAIEAVGGYQHHLYMEDYNLWLRVLTAGYVTANLPDVLVFARVGNNMIKRRKGMKYIGSEWKLFQLIFDNKLQPFLPAFKIFMLRAVVRLLPSSLLYLCYKFVRR